jgi:hypothetical protein
MSNLIGTCTATKGNAKLSPSFRNRVYLVITTFHFKGVNAGVSHYFQRLIQIFTKKHRGYVRYEVCDQRFDAQSSDDRFECLAIQGSNAKWGFYYEPSREEVFHRAIKSLPMRLDDYCFIDLGAGKGLPLLLASEYSFKSITGVEYSKTLADAANLNIRIHNQQTGSHARTQCIWGDAADFEFPSEQTILYLYNPFQGKVMTRVIANLEKSLRSAPRDLWVLYANPWEGRKFRRSPMFETIEWNSDYSLHRSNCR